MNNKPPLKKFRIGSIHLDVWENQAERTLADGSKVKRTYLSNVPGRTIRDKDGNWKDVDSYSFTDLLALREIVDDAINWHKQLTENGQQAVEDDQFDTGDLADAA